MFYNIPILGVKYLGQGDVDRVALSVFFSLMNQFSVVWLCGVYSLQLS